MTRASAPKHQRHGHGGNEMRRDSRFNTRWTEEQKELIERAATLSGQSISQFVLNAAQHAAMETISQHEIIVLSSQDSLAVMEALRNPEPAGPALQRAAESHRALIGDDQN
jgi:uncharacterized protein (DUF1778 family)